MAAAHLGELGCVKALLAAGADRDAEMDDGERALHLAARNGRADIVRELVAAGADPEAVEWVRGRRPAHNAAGGGHVEALLALDGDLNALEGGVWHCLHLLACNPATLGPEQLQAVLDAGADMSLALADGGKTPLDMLLSSAESARLSCAANVQALARYANTPFETEAGLAPV
jgi:ankyrin repeat protein